MGVSEILSMLENGEINANQAESLIKDSNNPKCQNCGVETMACVQCGKPIKPEGSYWVHSNGETYRHAASPVKFKRVEK